VYGSLPPETRVQQAALFNDPNNEYDFLVASDAIGMGLNLEIKRVVFESAQKFDGLNHRNLTIPEVKQIGGRAGRYRTVAENAKKEDDAADSASPKPPVTAWGTPGLVTTLDEEDLAQIHNSFSREAKPILTAGILPPTFIIEQFFSYFPPDTPLSFILAKLQELSRVSEQFHMCNVVELIDVADAIQGYKMSIADRCIFLNAPVSVRDLNYMGVLKAFARCVSELKGGHLLDIKEMDLSILEVDRRTSQMSNSEYLKRLEALHKAITLYLWLTYRFEGIFQSQGLAFHVKSLVEEKITDYLENLTFTDESRRVRRQVSRTLAEKHRKLETAMLAESKESQNQEADEGRAEQEAQERLLMAAADAKGTGTGKKKKPQGPQKKAKNKGQTTVPSAQFLSNTQQGAGRELPVAS
jgi:ATP-dependent RNA helicase SUPV3L1/SUV3